jgi:hypothetical protein
MLHVGLDLRPGLARAVAGAFWRPARVSRSFASAAIRLASFLAPALAQSSKPTPSSTICSASALTVSSRRPSAT